MAEKRECWGVSILSVLDGMIPRERARWDAAMTGKPDRLARHEAEPVLGHCLEALASAGEPVLTDRGCAILRGAIGVCAYHGADAALHAVARAKWRDTSNLEWLPDYLEALAGRPRDAAFACVEALMMNPVLARRPEVERLYNSLLGFAAIEGGGAGPSGGVDGYPLNGDAEQLRIDQLLRESYPPKPGAGSDGLDPLRAAIVKESAAEPGKLVLAVSARIQWHNERRKDFDEHQRLFWGVELGKLLLEASTAAGDMSLAALVKALEADSLGYLGLSPASTLLEQCRTHVAGHGWSPELVAAMEAWIKSLHGSTSALDLRQKAGWLLWFQDTSPVKPDECWSSRVRMDLSRMEPKFRRAWFDALNVQSFAATAKPPAKWMKPAKAAFAALGAENFRERFVPWFAAFREGKPLKLTVPGRDVLRLLMWYALLAADSVVDEALSWFAEAQWKTKDAASRAAKAEVAFSYVLAERAPDLAIPAFERIIASGSAFDGSRIHEAYVVLCAKTGKTPIAAKALPKPDPTEFASGLLKKLSKIKLEIGGF